MTKTAWQNVLYYGDNLEVMREQIPSGSIDLVYLDPPFNSNRNYNVIFGEHHQDVGSRSAAQIQAFGDTWTWTPVTGEQYTAAVGGGVPAKVADALSAMHTLLGENDAMAYLVNMAPRLVEIRRVLKSTGSLYLHCDPTMSQYLKVLLDAIFGAEHFRNEISWQRAGAKNDSLSVRLLGRNSVTTRPVRAPCNLHFFGQFRAGHVDYLSRMDGMPLFLAVSKTRTKCSNTGNLQRLEKSGDGWRTMNDSAVRRSLATSVSLRAAKSPR